MDDVADRAERIQFLRARAASRKSMEELDLERQDLGQRSDAIAYPEAGVIMRRMEEEFRDLHNAGLVRQ